MRFSDMAGRLLSTSLAACALFATLLGAPAFGASEVASADASSATAAEGQQDVPQTADDAKPEDTQADGKPEGATESEDSSDPAEKGDSPAAAAGGTESDATATGTGATGSDSASDKSGANATTGSDKAAPANASGSSKTTKVEKVTVATRFVGPDGEWAYVPSISLEKGATAWDATAKGLVESGMTFHTGLSSSNQDALVSLTSPVDGSVCAMDDATGSGWRLYINGDRYQGSASSLVLEDADEVEWRYEIGTIVVSVSVVGPGGTDESYWIAPTNVTIQATQTGWDASLVVFEQNGYDVGRLLSFASGDDGSVQLESLAALGANGVTGQAWQVFVNGAVPESDIAHVQLHAGDSICWYYAGAGVAELPDFATRTGAASQSPATAVHIEGTVTQAWSKDANADTDLMATLQSASGITVSGSGRFSSVCPATDRLSDQVTQVPSQDAWEQSLVHYMDVRLNTGVGGTAAEGADGSLYYLDGKGSLVKLEVL